MSKKIWLSYTTISNFYQSPHSWICKQLGLETPTTEAMQAGRDAHAIVTAHVCGVKKDERVPLDLEFQYPERKIFADYREGYGLYGLIDSISYKAKSFMEYKTSTKPWGQGQFDRLMQLPYYALLTGFKRVFMVTSTSDLQNFKTFYKEVTDKDIENVRNWIDTAIQNIEAGKFTTDLVDGKCTGHCPYQGNCYFL